MTGRNVSREIQRQFETHLLDGSWPVGMRLPPERKLAEGLGVSRSALRVAICNLKARGLLVSKWGSGVYVTDRLQSAISSPWRQMVVDHPDLRWDMLEFRRELEGATAYYAALRANKSDLVKMDGIIKRLTKAYETFEKDEERKADADFHEAIAEASHNSMFLYLHAGILTMLREHISLNLKDLEDPTGKITQHLCHQHLNIWDAILTHQPDVARLQMLAHIDFTRGELKRRAD